MNGKDSKKDREVYFRSVIGSCQGDDDDFKSVHRGLH